MKKMILLLLALGGSVINAGFQKTSHVGLTQDANKKFEKQCVDEDAFLIDLQPEFLGGNLFGVFDGHCGKKTARYMADSLSKNFRDALKKHRAKQRAHRYLDYRDSFFDSLAEIEKKLWTSNAKERSGSTALVAAQVGDDAIVLANVGDSRAVLIRNGEVVHSTFDHKTSNAQEKDRIKKAGGKIDGEYCYNKGAGFKITRTIGDIFAKQQMGQTLLDTNPVLSAVPDIYQWNTKPGDLLILATDGLWDVMDKKPNDSAVLEEIFLTIKCCGNKPARQNYYADLLCKKAKELGSKDNITVLTVQF